MPDSAPTQFLPIFAAFSALSLDRRTEGGVPR
jgi:hypothetical protein